MNLGQRIDASSATAIMKACCITSTSAFNHSYRYHNTVPTQGSPEQGIASSAACMQYI